MNINTAEELLKVLSDFETETCLASSGKYRLYSITHHAERTVLFNVSGGSWGWSRHFLTLEEAVNCYVEAVKG